MEILKNYCGFCSEAKKHLSNIKEIKSEILQWLLVVINIQDDISPRICYTCQCNFEDIECFIENCKRAYKRINNLIREEVINMDREQGSEETNEQNYSVEYLKEETLSESNDQKFFDSSSGFELESIDNKCSDGENEKEENLSVINIDIESPEHIHEGKFECEFCHARFNNRSQRTDHVKEHNFFCTECGLNFTTKSKFKYHIANHKNKRDFQCRYCSKAFNHRSDLTNHSRFQHAGIERPRKYKCDICEKNFCTPTELKIHLRFHRNERPFKCHLCDHAYVIKCHLQQHLKRHADIKDKVCNEPGCGKAYRDMSSLKKHMDMHLPDDNKKYTCDVCDRRFSFFYILSDHRRKSHRKIALLQPLKKDEIKV